MSESFVNKKTKNFKQCLKEKFDCEILRNDNFLKEETSVLGNSEWSDAFSLSMPNIINPKQAWKSSTGRISQTINNVRITFGTISQKLKKSTKRRQPLKNVDSPPTPITPYTKSKALLGRTPTRLYSPFYIDTPVGKENKTNRNNQKRTPKKCCFKFPKKEFKLPCKALGVHKNCITTLISETRLSNDTLQAQVGIYEFQSVANNIAQENFLK